MNHILEHKHSKWFEFWRLLLHHWQLQLLFKIQMLVRQETISPPHFDPQEHYRILHLFIIWNSWIFFLYTYTNYNNGYQYYNPNNWSNYDVFFVIIRSVIRFSFVITSTTRSVITSTARIIIASTWIVITSTTRSVITSTTTRFRYEKTTTTRIIKAATPVNAIIVYDFDIRNFSLFFIEL